MSSVTDYYKIQYATQCVRELGAEFIATNRCCTKSHPTPSC